MKLTVSSNKSRYRSPMRRRVVASSNKPNRSVGDIIPNDGIAIYDVIDGIKTIKHTGNFKFQGVTVDGKQFTIYTEPVDEDANDIRITDIQCGKSIRAARVSSGNSDNLLKQCNMIAVQMSDDNVWVGRGIIGDKVFYLYQKDVGSYRVGLQDDNTLRVLTDDGEISCIIKSTQDMKKFINSLRNGVHQNESDNYSINAGTAASYIDDTDEWTEIRSKSIPDSDGFYTDYTLYRNADSSYFICMFGDKDLYPPDVYSADFETEDYDEAITWFDNYEGLDDSDEVYGSESSENELGPDITSQDDINVTLDDVSDVSIRFNADGDNNRPVQSAEDFEDQNVYDEIQEISQEFTSENTSINSGKLPAVFNMVSFEPGTINIDYGGGRFDNVAEYLTQYDVINLVYDPYNRSKEHNKEVIKTVRAAGGADTATCSNVLNVIKEPEVRLNVLQNIKKLVKPGGKVYITVYEGKGNGAEEPTKSGYQLNRKTADYIEEIMQVFPDATRKGKLITAINASTNIRSSSGVMSSEIAIDDAIGNEIYSEVINKVSLTMQSPEFGFEANEVDQYSSVNISEEEDGRYRVEVRAELSYEGMDMLADSLNPTVQYYDSDSYFDMVEPGIMEAYIDPSSVNASITTSSNSSDILRIIGYRDYEDTHYAVVYGPGASDSEFLNFINKDGSLHGSGSGLHNQCWIAISNKEEEEYLQAMLDKYNSQNTIQSSDNLSKGIYTANDLLPGPGDYDPPNYPDPQELEDVEDEVEITVDSDIEVEDSEGNWNFVEDGIENWAINPDNQSGDWESDEYHSVKLDDPAGVIEKVYDVITPLIPARPGRYHITADVTLVYDLTHILDYGRLGPEEYEPSIDTDDIEVNFNFAKSHADNFKQSKL